MPCLFTSNICVGTLGRGAAHRATSWHAHRWRIVSIWAAEQRRCAFTHATQIKQVTLEGLGSLPPSPCREPWARQHSLAAKFLETAPASGGEKPGESCPSCAPRLALPLPGGAELCPAASPAPGGCWPQREPLFLLLLLTPPIQAPPRPTFPYVFPSPGGCDFN